MIFAPDFDIFCLWRKFEWNLSSFTHPKDFNLLTLKQGVLIYKAARVPFVSQILEFSFVTIRVKPSVHSESLLNCRCYSRQHAVSGINWTSSSHACFNVIIYRKWEWKNTERGKCHLAKAHPNYNSPFNYNWQKTWRQRAEAGPGICVCAWKQHLLNTLVLFLSHGVIENKQRATKRFCLCLHSSVSLIHQLNC